MLTIREETIGEDEKKQCTARLEEAQEALENLETGDELEKRHGPVCSRFDDILKKHKITPQAYHSRAFNGNHCHKYVTKCVYKQLTACSVTTVHNCTKNVHIIEEAERIKRQFDMLNEAFAKVHAKISHGRPIGRDEYDEIHRG